MKNLSKPYFISIIVFIFIYANASSQEDSSQQELFKQIYVAAEQEQGLNHELINGIFYIKQKTLTKGHPYLEDNVVNPGSLVYRGKEYNDVRLLYNIFEQEILMLDSLKGAYVILYLTKEFVSKFSILDKNFVKLNDPGSNKIIYYQIIGEGLPFMTLYKWMKIMDDFNNVVEYTEEIKTCYIMINDSLVRFKSNRSFAGIFPDQNKKQIRIYIRQNKIRTRYCSDEKMKSLLIYCNSLINNTSN